MLMHAGSSRIGSGGMGDVSKAIDARLKRELAIKVIDAEQEKPARRSRSATGAINPSNVHVDANAESGVMCQYGVTAGVRTLDPIIIVDNTALEDESAGRAARARFRYTGIPARHNRYPTACFT